MKQYNSPLRLFRCAVAAALILFAGCGRPVTQRVDSSADPKTDSTTVALSAAPAHFWFNYRSQPNPGLRVWMRVNATNWVEVYPNGSESRYVIVERSGAFDQTGTVVRKVSGNERETWTPNDGSFEAFIPDKGQPKPVLGFRHYQAGEWSAWQALAVVKVIE